jgi:hypothetical protein
MAGQQVADVNVGNIMKDISVYLMVNVFGDTLAKQNATEKMWTDSNQALTTAQVSNPVANPQYRADVQAGGDSILTCYTYTYGGITYVPGFIGTAQEINKDSTYNPNANPPTPPFTVGSVPYLQWQIVSGMNGVVKSGFNSGTFHSFVGKYESSIYVNAMSQALGATILGLLSRSYNSGDPQKSQADMSTITGFNQILSANAQQQESTGLNQAKTMSSNISTTTTLPSNISNLFTTVSQCITAGISALSNGIV